MIPFILATLVFCSFSPAELPIGTGHRQVVVLENRVYQFPAYEAVPDMRFSGTRSEYLEAIADARFEMRRLVYRSDGLKVSALLYGPKEPMGAPLPLIIYNRGSLVRGDIAPEVVVQFRRFALEGYAVIAPLLRGSDSMEGKDELGGADLQDIVNIWPVARSFEWIDMDQVFMTGESRGGMMTYYCLREGLPVTAAAVVGAITDMEAFITETPELKAAVIDTMWPDFDARRDEYLTSRSAVRWVERIAAPVLILHGGADRSVSPDQPLRFARVMLAGGKVFELCLIEGENHVISRDAARRDRLILDWFRKYRN